MHFFKSVCSSTTSSLRHQNPVNVCVKLSLVPLHSVFSKRIRYQATTFLLISYTPLISYEHMLGQKGARISQGQGNFSGIINCELVVSLLRDLDLQRTHHIYITNQKAYYLKPKQLHLSYFTGSRLFKEEWVGTCIPLHE